MTSGPETPQAAVGDHPRRQASTSPLTGPAVRSLPDRLVDRLDAVSGDIAADQRPATRPLEVGAGALGQRLQERFGTCVALDLPGAGLREQRRSRPGPTQLHADPLHLPVRDGAFDLVGCVDVLQRLRDPAAGLRELARVSSRHLLLAVPHEPFSRASNLLTGRHVRSLGRTPGHLQHWTGAGFQRFVSTVGNVRSVASPGAWTVVWATRV